jgi:hypothetical protein
VSADDVEKARQMFCKMPPEVFDLWIGPGVKNHGWSFLSTPEPSTKFERIFSGSSLRDWVTLNWNFTSLPLKQSIFHPQTVARAEAIIGHCVRDEQTVTANLHNSKKRFWACAAFIGMNRTVPQPLIAVNLAMDFEIVDGNHRIAALIHLGFGESFQIPVWLGVP